jgi:hypothetical protein
LSDVVLDAFGHEFGDERRAVHVRVIGRVLA